jgi:hypothetical protein
LARHPGPRAAPVIGRAARSGYGPSPTQAEKPRHWLLPQIPDVALGEARANAKAGTRAQLSRGSRRFPAQGVWPNVRPDLRTGGEERLTSGSLDATS